MSIWTHVAAVIRFDALRLPGMPDQTPQLGNTCDFEDGEAAWEACDVPCGSESSLQWQLWENPSEHAMAAYTAMIWGGLRDYEDVDEVVAYLTRITKGRMIRQGVASIEVETGREAHLRYSMDDGRWEVLQEQASALTPHSTGG